MTSQDRRKTIGRLTERRLSGWRDCVLILLACTGGGQADDVAIITPVQPPERTSLLTADSFPGQGWVFYPGKRDARLEETWTLQVTEDGPVLICRGEPHGYLRTTQVYREFEFGLEWKYPRDSNGNSGVLVFTEGEDRIWPKSVQVQLHQPNTGSVFGSGGAQIEPAIMRSDLSRPVNQWNQLQVSCHQGAVRVTVNGKEVGDVKVLSPQAGAIGLQSEGSEVHFRNIWIRDLAPVARSADASGAMSYCPPCWYPVNCDQPLVLPTHAVNPAYQPMSGGWTPTFVSPTVSGYYYFRPGTRYVADGIPLAGRGGVQRSGRSRALARAPTWEWTAGGGRRSARFSRGGRSRR